MKFRSILLLAVAFVLLAISCKKKEEETTYLSFVGTPDFTMPSFVEVGQTFTLTPKGVSRASSDERTTLPGCYWNIPALERKDTLRREGDGASVSTTIVFQVPDTLLPLTVSCSMFAQDYSNTSCSQSSVVVRSKGGYSSLQGIDYPLNTFRDARDGHIYHYAKVAGTDWMAENMAYPECGFSYLECAVVDPFFGRYYTWKEALQVCPEGWTLPTNADFLALNNAFLTEAETDAAATFMKGAGNHMANAYFNSTRMWTYWPDVIPTNRSGLSLIPTGYAAVVDGKPAFTDVLKYSMIWTADAYDEDQAYYRSIYEKYDTFNCEKGYKDHMAMSVRCIRKTATD